MAKDVFIIPSEGLVQFSSSAGSGSGKIQADGDDIVISNALGDVLLGDGASDVFIGDGTNNVDIVFEQNGEIKDDGSGKNIIFGSKTTNVFISGSNTVALQSGGGNVGIGKTSAGTELEVVGSISASGTISALQYGGNVSGSSTSTGSFGKVIATTIDGTLSDSTRTDITSILATDLILGEDAQTKIDFETEDEIHFYANNAQEMIIQANVVAPGADNGTALGDADQRWSDLFLASGGVINFNNGDATITGDGDNLDLVHGQGSKEGGMRINTLGNIMFATVLDNNLNFGTDVRLFITSSTGNVGIGDNVFNPGEKLEVVGNISASGAVTASAFKGDGTGLSNVSATVADESITLAKLAHAAANTVLVRDANSTGDPSFKAVTNTQILIGDGTGFTAAALSGDVTMTNGGVVTIGANAVEGSMLNTNVAGTGLTVAGNNIDVDAAQTQITSVGTLTGLFVDSHITASGNISASGDIITTGTGSFAGGGIFGNHVSFSDKNITNVGTIDVDKIRADAATNVNIELKTSGIKFNAEAGDTFTFNDVYNNTDLNYYDANEDVIFTIDQSVPGIGIGALGGAPAESLDVEGNAQVNGNVIVAGSVIHKGDTNTSIAFTADAIAFNAGGVEMLKLTEAATNTITLGAAISTNITASGNISCSGNIIGELTGIDGDVTGVDSILNTGLKIGRDSTDLIDFATADNVIGFRVGNNDEMKLNTTSLQPATSNGLALGASNRQWSDLFLAEGGVINFDNGDVTLTQTGNNLTMAGGSLSASGDFGVSGTATITTNKFNKTSNTDADHQGDVVFFGGTTSMDAGKIYAYGNDGTWNLSDADHNNLSGSGLLGVALGAASDTNGMLLRGTVTLDHDPGAVGDVLYLSTTAGRATSTVPSGNTDIARVVGYCLDASNGQIWFNPDNTFVEVSA